MTTIGRVYKITNEDESLIYIGSTQCKLNVRLSLHKFHYKLWKANRFAYLSVFEIFDKCGVDNIKIQLLDEINYDDKKDLYRIEANYIKNLKSINKNIPLQTRKEYYEIHKNEISQKVKQYYLNNIDLMTQKAKQYYSANIEKKRLYYLANRDKKLEYQKNYQLKKRQLN